MKTVLPLFLLRNSKVTGKIQHSLDSPRRTDQAGLRVKGVSRQSSSPGLKERITGTRVITDAKYIKLLRANMYLAISVRHCLKY